MPCKEKNAAPPVIHVYGPVPSRRLGFSLGIDILPFKTCSLDCIYCQLGPTPEKTVLRQAYFTETEILAQIEERLKSPKRIDYITFSGSGEPTLNSLIDALIQNIKRMTSIPVAVLTNSTLLIRPEVRRGLLEADLVVPSLDAVTQDVFERVNRPHPTLRIDDIIEALIAFRQEFRGRIWLEIMLVRDINDDPSHLEKLKAVIARIEPDRIQLNTVVRPPAEDFAQPLTREQMESIRDFLGEKSEIIAEFTQKDQIEPSDDLRDEIAAMISRRPVTLEDISASLGVHQNEAVKYLNFLVEEGRIRIKTHEGRKYYEPKSDRGTQPVIE